MDFNDILESWDRRQKEQRQEGKRGSAVPSTRERSALAREESERSPGDERAPKTPLPKAPREEPRRVDPLTAWIRVHGVYDKDRIMAEEETSPSERRRRLHSKAPDASIDLHGLKRDEAWAGLEAFFADATRQGLEKVMIVHGKGNHSDGDAILKSTVRQFLEQCPQAGETGHPPAALGGSGATWVLLKKNRREA